MKPPTQHGLCDKHFYFEYPRPDQSCRICQLEAELAVLREELRRRDWIKTEEQLPQIGRLVLGYYPKTRANATYFCVRECDSWYDENGEEVNDPTYWSEFAPLPKSENL